jgi:hypothetical protein
MDNAQTPDEELIPFFEPGLVSDTGPLISHVNERVAPPVDAMYSPADSMLRALLIQARESAGFTITDLARLIADRTGRSVEGVRTTIQRYEAVGGPEPRASTVQDVLEALGLELRVVKKSGKKSVRRS